MATILVDYENVQGFQGLKGVEQKNGGISRWGQQFAGPYIYLDMQSVTTYNKNRSTRIDYMEEVPMKKEIYNLEGIEIEVEKYDKNDKDAERRHLAYCFRMIREKSGMSRTDFSVWLGVPYRTMQEWELGRRAMPEYVLRLIAYKVMNELREGRIG